MLSANDLAAMRATALASLDTSVTIQRNTAAQDGWGSLTDTWATVATVQGRIGTPQTPALGTIAAQIGEIVLYRVSLPYGTDLRVEDRLLVGSSTFRVHALESLQSYATTVQAFCAEVR